MNVKMIVIPMTVRRKRKLAHPKNFFPTHIFDDRKKIYIYCIIILLPLALIFKQTIRLFAMQDRLAVLNKQVDVVREETKRMEAERDKLKSGDKDAIEKLAREQLKLAKPGEIIYAPTNQ